MGMMPPPFFSGGETISQARLSGRPGPVASERAGP